MKELTLTERLHLDLPLLFGLLLLCGIGLLVLYSAAGQDSRLLWRQGMHMGIAFVLMMLLAQIPPAQLARLSLWAYLLGVSLLLLVVFFGDTGKGAQRWLDLKWLRFQPSELMKLVLPMALAWYFSERSLPPSLGRIIVACLMIIVPVWLIARQPDLGTALLVATSGLSILFIAGVSWKLIAAAGFSAALSAPVWWYLMHDYQRRRVLTFLNPENDPLGAGYHIIQSKIAIGSGGLYGKGWLNGTQSQLDFLPERSTDFIFAVLCEEFGLMGVLFLIGLYLFIIARGLYIAMYAQHSFGRLLGAGIMLTFFVYVFVNIGMVSGQLPVVGVPLPLISYGGTSMLTLLLGFGILMGIQTHRRLLTG